MKRMPSSDGAGVAGRDAAFMDGESSRSVVARRFAARSSGQLGKPFLELRQQAPAHLGLAIGQILLFHRIARKIIQFAVGAAIVGTQFTVTLEQIGRASCRARVCTYVLISLVAVSVKKTKI